MSEIDFWSMLEEFFDPDIELNQLEEIAGTAGTFHGYSGLRDAAIELAQGFSEVEFQPQRHFAAGDTVVFEMRAVGTGRRSGVRTDMRFAHLRTLKDRRAVRWSTYPTLDEALEAAGISP
jgi:ketosteroid isomerase-like protein